MLTGLNLRCAIVQFCLFACCCCLTHLYFFPGFTFHSFHQKMPRDTSPNQGNSNEGFYMNESMMPSEENVERDRDYNVNRFDYRRGFNRVNEFFNRKKVLEVFKKIALYSILAIILLFFIVTWKKVLKILLHYHTPQ